MITYSKRKIQIYPQVEAYSSVLAKGSIYKKQIALESEENFLSNSRNTRQTKLH